MGFKLKQFNLTHQFLSINLNRQFYSQIIIQNLYFIPAQCPGSTVADTFHSSSNGIALPPPNSINKYIPRISLFVHPQLLHSTASFMATSGSYLVLAVTPSPTDNTHPNYLFHHPQIPAYVHLFSTLSFHPGPI